ncbi:MAG TPA: carboxypeptidase regulatory-like domain-containing protein [Myxococcota bacterium]|nr:carboxypeptidase regulatory-like domain-containing protein [Myxococcota bacterium]
MRPIHCALLAALLAPLAAHGDAPLGGRVVDAGSGAPIAGARVTAERGDPAYRVTVFSADDGSFALPTPNGDAPWRVRARRIGWEDVRIDGVVANGAPLALRARRHTDPAEVAAQLPANHWYARVMRGLPADEQHILKRECTYCHQQGAPWTRRVRTDEDWQKILALMGRRGAMLPARVRDRVPALFNAAYEPTTAVPELTRGWQDADAFAPPPSAEVRRAIVEEWDLGGRASMQHDVIVHPDGTLYSVDGAQDALFRLDPRVPEGARESWKIEVPGIERGGIFAGEDQPQSQASSAHVGPHSLQVAPDGAVWITLAIGNRLARFDPTTEQFQIHEVADGFYPHTLRFDREGRIWYTMSASNHVGRFDPTTGKQLHVRLPARTLKQELALRLMPLMFWLDARSERIDLRANASESADGFNMPVPYGIDIAPDGGVWFSQLNENRIGRIDPETLAVELIETPFPAPRRLRFDARGRLWIPSFTTGRIASFDPATRAFDEIPLPIQPLAGETPYALAIEPRTQHVWVCGTNSDTLIRFDPETRRFAVYPLPTRVTYTRELDFDAEGRVWTSDSNSPAWQIERGQPIVIRLDVDGAAAGAGVAAK